MKIGNIPEKIDSRFRFVLLSAVRAEQLMVGAIPKVAAEGEKSGSVAMKEVTDGLLSWDYGSKPEPEVEETEAEGAAEETE